MKRSAILAAAAVAAVLVYPWVHAQLFGLGTVYLLTPELLHGAKHLGGHTALVLLHMLVSFALTLLLFVPVAILIALGFPRSWPLVAAAAALSLLLPSFYATPAVWNVVFDHAQYIGTLTLAVVTIFSAALGSTYLAWRLTSNNRWRGP